MLSRKMCLSYYFTEHLVICSQEKLQLTLGKLQPVLHREPMPTYHIEILIMTLTVNVKQC